MNNPFDKILKNKLGTTLVETLMAVFIFLMISGGLLAILLSSDRSWQTNKIRIELQQEVRKAMDWMKYELRQAGPSSIANVPSNGTWYSTITFKIPSGISAGSIAWQPNNIQFVRGGTGGNQLQRIEAGATRILANNIQTLQFRRLATNPDMLEVSMLAQKNTPQGRSIDYQLDFKVQLRN